MMFWISAASDCVSRTSRWRVCSSALSCTESGGGMARWRLVERKELNELKARGLEGDQRPSLKKGFG